MTGTRHQVNDLLQEGWEVYTVDEVRARHEAETRRMWLPRGRRTRLYVDREKASQSFLKAPGLTTRRMRIYPEHLLLPECAAAADPRGVRAPPL